MHVLKVQVRGNCASIVTWKSKPSDLVAERHGFVMRWPVSHFLPFPRLVLLPCFSSILPRLHYTMALPIQHILSHLKYLITTLTPSSGLPAIHCSNLAIA